MASSSEIPSLYHYRFGIFELDGRSRELRRNGVKLKLQDQPYQVLLKLLEHAGQVVGRDELRSALWAADTFVDFETGLNTTIRRLRETLGDSAENPTFIETIPKRGYRFLAPVSTLDSVPPSIADRIQIDAGKSKLRIALRLGIVLSLTGLLAGFSLKHLTAPARPPEKLLNFAQLTNDGQAKVGPLLTDGSRIYFSEVLPSGRVMVQVSTRGGETISLPTSLSDPRPVDISPDGTELLVLSGKELVAKEHAIGVGLWIVPVAGGSARPVGDVLAMDAIWNTDNKKILYSEGHDIYLVNRDGSNQTTFLTISGYADYLRWSPNGQRLRFTMTDRLMEASSSLWEVAANGKDLHPVLGESKESSICCGWWTANGDDFLFQSASQGRTDLWELTSKHDFLRPSPPPIRLTAGPMNFSRVAASRTRDEVFAIGSLPRAELVKYEPQTGEFAPYLSGISAEGAESSRDAHWVAYTSFPEGTLWRSNRDGGEKLQLTFPPMRALLPRWSPDGTQIAFIGSATPNYWTSYVIPANGGVAQELAPGTGQLADPTWTPDGKFIVFGPWKTGAGEFQGIGIVDLTTKKIIAVPDANDLWSPRISPDGRYIAAMTRDEKRMMLFDRTTKKWEEIAAFYSAYPSWSHDGKFLYFQDWSNGDGFPSRIVRIRISDRKLETALDLRHVSRLPIGTFVTWSGLAPDDSILLARDISAQELYSLKW